VIRITSADAGQDTSTTNRKPRKREDTMAQSTSNENGRAKTNGHAQAATSKRRLKSAAPVPGTTPVEKYSAHDPCSLILSKTCVYRMIDASHTTLRIAREMSDYRHGNVD